MSTNMSLDDMKNDITTSENTNSEPKEFNKEVPSNDSFVPVDIAEIRDYETPVKKPGIEDKMFAALDAGIDRFKSEVNRVAEQVAVENAEEAVEKELDNEMKDNGFEPDTNPVLDVDKEDTDEDIDDNSEEDWSNIDKDLDMDFDDDDDDLEENSNEPTEEEVKEIYEKFKGVVDENIIPIKHNIDLKSFTISTKPTSLSKTMRNTNNLAQTADWLLYRSNRSNSMTELNGIEIEKINSSLRMKNTFNVNKDRYMIIYNKINDANKPATFEAWCKTVNFFDIDDLFFNAYIATYGTSNHLPYNCEDHNCREMYIERDVPIDNMVKYSSKEIEEKVKAIREKDTTSDTNELTSELLQVSDNYVLAIRNASLHSVIFEPLSLPDSFRNKYSDLVSIITHIEAAYEIDREYNQLVPIEYKKYPNNMAKTVGAKYKLFGFIINSLSSDQLSVLNTHLATIDTKGDGDIKYIIPSSTCPKCQSVIEEQEMAPMNMLFTRYQLARMKD